MFGIIISIVIFVIILVIVLISFLTRNKHHDAQDGGNTHISIFEPSNDRAGKKGELYANSHLRLLLEKDEHLLTGLLLPRKNGGFKAEVDAVLVTHKGVFCIETKHWIGKISGNDLDKEWKQECFDERKSKTHRNPVKQNQSHCSYLEKILNNRFYVENVVIFVALENGSEISSEYTYTLRQFENYYNGLDKILTDKDIEFIHQRLKNYVANESELKKNKQLMKEYYKD